MKNRIDRLDKRILANLENAIQIDVEALARTVGCLEEVAKERYRRLLETGVINGFVPRIAQEQLPVHELLVAGVPSEVTDDRSIEKVCDEPDVASFFTMAAHASMAFVIRGDDLEALRSKADRLAREAGLQEHRGILVVKHLHDNPHAGASWHTSPELEAPAT